MNAFILEMDDGKLIYNGEVRRVHVTIIRILPIRIFKCHLQEYRLGNGKRLGNENHNPGNCQGLKIKEPSQAIENHD